MVQLDSRKVKVVGYLVATGLIVLVVVFVLSVVTSPQGKSQRTISDESATNQEHDVGSGLNSKLGSNGILGNSDSKRLGVRPTLDQLESSCPGMFLYPSIDCLLAGDEYFLDLTHQPSVEESVFLTSGEQMTYRRAFTDAVSRYETLRHTMSNEECRVVGDEVQWDLTEPCNAHLVADTVFLWGVCIRDYDAYQSLDPSILGSFYEEAMQELELEHYVSIEDYVQAKHSLKEKYFRQAWIDTKCKNLPKSVYESMGIFEFDIEARVVETRDRRISFLSSLSSGNTIGSSEEVFDPLDIRERITNWYDIDDPERLLEAVNSRLHDDWIRKDVALEESNHETAHLRSIAQRLGNDWALVTATPGAISTLRESLDESRPWLSKFSRFRTSILRASDSDRIHFTISTLRDLRAFDVKFEPGPIWSLVCHQISSNSTKECAEYLNTIDFDSMNSDVIGQVVSDALESREWDRY